MSAEAIIKETIEENYKLFDTIEKHKNYENYQKEVEEKYKELEKQLADSYEKSVGKYIKEIEIEHKKEMKTCNKDIKIKSYQITDNGISFDSFYSITNGIKNISEDISDSYFYGGSVVKIGLKLMLNILITIPFMLILIIIKFIGLFK